jgi:hypothetical protein
MVKRLMTISGSLHFLQHALAARIIVLAVLLASAACKSHQPKELPVVIPQGDAPIVVLASRSLSLLPNPYFVLYANGRVIFGDPGQLTPAYRTAMLPPDHVSDIYSRVSPSVLDAWDNEVFTPGGSAAPTYFLFVRRNDEKFVSMATYSFLPNSAWSAQTQPPSAVKQALEFLTKYEYEAASPWTPAEIEVAFQSAVPHPEHKAWWPRSWPQPTNTQRIPTIRLDSSHVKELNAHLRVGTIARIGKDTYSVFPRYPFLYEEVVLEPMNKLAKKGGAPF